MMTHQEALRKRLSKMAVVQPPSPWRPVISVAIGGLADGGYLPDSDIFLAITSSGRGLFEAMTGKRIGRDREDGGAWIDEIQLTATSIAPHEDVQVRIAGLSGGGLPHSTRDGWRLEMAAPDWPRIAVFLQPLGCSVLVENRASGARKIFDDYEPRVVGFSETGRSFVIGTSDTLYFFGR
ncbi:MAG TPA: hypothetical protein VG734_01325 [Lacunisphaera sp.]|nr:hypothetical protein [Lacunisphaera sp.]